MRNLVFILAGLGVIAAAAFWMFSKNDYVFRFSEGDLRDHLDARLPYEGRHLFVFDVTLDNPRVDLVEGSDRVAGGIDVMLEAKVAGRELSLSGAADMSGGVRYDADERAFYMTDPIVEALRIPGVPESYANRANTAISSALSDFYRTRPIYVLEADTAAESAARLLLKDVSVKNEHLVVTLGISKKQEPAAD